MQHWTCPLWTLHPPSFTDHLRCRTNCKKVTSCWSLGSFRNTAQQAWTVLQEVRCHQLFWTSLKSSTARQSHKLPWLCLVGVLGQIYDPSPESGRKPSPSDCSAPRTLPACRKSSRESDSWGWGPFVGFHWGWRPKSQWQITVAYVRRYWVTCLSSRACSVCHHTQECAVSCQRCPVWRYDFQLSNLCCLCC